MNCSRRWRIRYGICERQSEAAARVLEVAGGLTPTIGVLGTVVGLIDVLRQFSSLSTVASGVGAAFTSTFYGLALANVALLPVAHRIRAWASETFDFQEMMTEGTLCLFDGMHPRLIRQRLRSYLNALPEQRSLTRLSNPHRKPDEHEAEIYPKRGQSARPMDGQLRGCPDHCSDFLPCSRCQGVGGSAGSRGGSASACPRRRRRRRRWNRRSRARI